MGKRSSRERAPARPWLPQPSPWLPALWQDGTGCTPLLSALAGSMGLLLYARRRLGGVTEDVFGCTVECTEWLVLLTFCTL